jgi:hypothetical protein
MIYQDALRTPGMSPSEAASRKHRRHIPKSRMNARLRPQRKQRFTARELNFGVFFERAMTDVLAIYRKKQPRRARMNILERGSEVKLPLFLKRKSEMGEKGRGFFFVFGGGNDRHSKTKDIFDVLVSNLREDAVLTNTERVVTHIIYS